ncbi:MAG: TonB-dependent receptor [Candidatus Azobacteroides sp.]|nr:TonB-dependent receptor [Candidatus Azobacteroides sp.]
MKKKLFTILFLLGTFSVFAQNIPIQGIVVSGTDDEPLPGVTIAVKGSTTGTMTDIEGAFSFSVPENAILSVSYIGYQSQEIAVGNRTDFRIVLQDDNQLLNEVVVVGYGVQKKSVVTAAIGSVTGESLSKLNPTRIDNVLKGQTAGVTIFQESGQPGAGSKVRIRGTGTINNSDPLYIVDGFIVNGGIDYLNPQDIERVEVLKDAASAAVYGARGANGVVLVTTKGGTFNKKTSVSYDFSYGWQNAWKKRSVLNAREYQILMNEQAINSGKTPAYDLSSTINTDWQEEVFNSNAPVINHQVSIDGGNDKVSYFLSFGYYSQDGIVGGNFDRSNYERWSIRNNNTYKIMDAKKERNFLHHATIGTNLSYSRILSTGVEANSEYGSPLGSALLLSPLIPVYATDEDLQNSFYQGLNTYVDPKTDEEVTKERWVRSKDGRVYSVPGNYSQYNEIVNPLAAMSLPGDKHNSDKFVVNGWLELGIWDNLKFRTSIGSDLAFWGNNGWGHEYYLGTTNHSTRSSVWANKYRGVTWQVDNTLSYDKTIEKHSFAVLLGQSAIKNWEESIGASNYYLPSNNPDKAWIDYATGTAADRNGWGSRTADHAISSLFGRLSYNYDERYMGEFTVRRDGSSNFGKNNLYATFPSVSAGWNIHNEAFMESTRNWLTMLKVRASWGKNGNENIDAFRYTTTINSGNNYPFGKGENMIINTGVKPNGIANADLRWEESQQTDIGFDARFLNNALTFSFDYYDKRTNGMLMDVPLPNYVGDNRPIGNVGKMKNSGVEMEIGYRFNVSDFRVNLSANATYLKNKLLDLGNENGWSNYDDLKNVGTITRAQNGEPFPYFYGKKTNGIFQNQEEIDTYTWTDPETGVSQLIQPNAQPGDVRFVDLNNDGKIDDDDRTKIGKGTPDWIFGFNISLEYKGFDLNAMFYSTVGNDIYDGTRRTDLPYVNLPSYMLDRWHGEGTSNTIPRLVEGDLNENWLSSDLYVQDGSFLRLKNIQLGYTLPDHLTRKAFVNRLRVYVSAENLLTFTKYRGFDPEISSGGTSLGVDRGVYPQARTISVGVNLSF